MRTAESATLDASLDLEAIETVLREHPVRLAILFGSHATETTHETSDIDLAVEFDDHRPGDSNYNRVFLGLGVDLSSALGTDDVDVIDLHTASPSFARAIFENGILLVGDQDHAAELRRQLTDTDIDQQSPRERIEAALERIDDHLDDRDTGVPATGDAEDAE